MERGGIAVVGSGPGGLAAAWRLSALGRTVRVYEAASRPGGRLRTEVVAGRGSDVGVQLVSSGYESLRRLVGDLSLGDRLVPVPGRDALWRDGVAHGLRYGSISSMVASGALPARLKLALGVRYVPFLERHGRVLDLNRPSRAAEAGLDEVSIAEWGREHVGDAFVEMLAYPLLAAYYGVTPEETSAVFFHALARAGTSVEVLGARGGFGPLAAAIAAALERRGVELRAGRAVRSLQPTEGGVAVATDAGSTVHEGVVLAVPPAEAARLAPAAGIASAVRTRSTAVLTLSLGRRAATGWFGLSVPRSEEPGRTIAAVCAQSEKAAGVVGGEGDALVLIPSPAVGARWADADAGTALEEGLAALELVQPGLGGVVEEARLVRLPGTVWVPEPGWFRRLAGWRPDALPPWLALAGDYLVAPTVEGAVRSGLAAAERIDATTAGRSA